MSKLAYKLQDSIIIAILGNSFGLFIKHDCILVDGMFMVKICVLVSGSLLFPHSCNIRSKFRLWQQGIVKGLIYFLLAKVIIDFELFVKLRKTSP